MSSLIYRDIELARQRRDARKQDAPERFLARQVRYGGNLRVPNRPGYVYCQQIPDDDAPYPLPVLCVATQIREGQTGWVEKNRDNLWEFVAFSREIVNLPDYTGQAYLPGHHADHEWPDKHPGPDALTVYPRAWGPLRAYPGEGGGITVSVAPYRYIYQGTVVRFDGDLSVDLSGSQPAAGSALYVGIYLDPSTNAIGTVDGATTTDSPTIEPDAPTFPDGMITIAQVRLDGDQTAFLETDFLDLRMFIGNAEVGVDNWPFDTVTVDLSDPGADYSDIDAAFTGAGGSKVYVLGPGAHTQDSVAAPATVSLFAFDRNTTTTLAGFLAGGIEGFQATNGAFYARGFYFTSSDASNDVAGAVVTSATFDHCRLIGFATAGNDAYGIYCTSGTVVNVFGGEITPVSSAGSTYGISGFAGATINLYDVPRISADTLLTGGGTFIGYFQDAIGNLYKINGAAGTEVLVSEVITGTVEGRLTLATGTPVTTADQAAKTTVYFTPYKGDYISLYDGAKWVLYSFTEKSVAVPATTNTPFDVFIYDNAGTLTLETVNWTNDTTRATALTTQDGVYVKSGATGRRYLGTGRTTGSSGETEDSEANRLLWNYYNRIPTIMFLQDSTSHTYSTAAYRSWNNDASLRVTWIVGILEEYIWAVATGDMTSDGTVVAITGAGLNTTTNSNLTPFISAGAARIRAGNPGRLLPQLGYNYLQAVEYASGAPAPTFTVVVIQIWTHK